MTQTLTQNQLTGHAHGENKTPVASSETRTWLLILALAALKLFIHILASGNYELHRDTYLYLALADHPAWGYISVPPLIAMLARGSLWVLGDSQLAIRFLPALAGAGSVVVIGLVVRALGGRRWAIGLAASAFILSPAYLRSNTLLQPVSFNQFAWLLSGYLLLRLLQTQNRRYWLGFGVLWGLAFLNKYSIVFYAAAILLAVGLTEHRRLFPSKYFAFGLAIGALIVVPNLLWQAQHNWPVVGHMEELRRTQLVNVRLSDFLFMQFLMNLHAVPLWLFGLLFLLVFKQGRPFRALAYAFLAVILLLMLLSGKAYYSLGAYPALFAAGGVAIEKYAKGRWRLVRPAMLALLAVIALPVVPYGLPILPIDRMLTYAEGSKKYGFAAALMWEDGKIHALPQDYADMVGWRELAEVVGRAYLALPDSERAACVIYASNYGEAGAIRFYGKQFGLPEPVCFNETFVLWAPDSIELRALIYVNDELGEDIAEYFSDIQIAGRLSNPYARESGLPVYVCRGPRPGVAEYYKERVGMLKRRYR